MDYRQLTYFMVTARREHMGAAAAELGISEPALSRSIGRLERQFGAQLFDRVGRGVRLNAYGKLLLEHSARAFGELDACEQKIRSASAGEEQVTVGFIPSLGTTVIPRILQTTGRLETKIRLRFQEGRGPLLRTMLLNGDVDLYLGTLLVPDPAIEWQPAWDEGVVALVRGDHRLAEYAAIDLPNLARDPWLVVRSAGTTRRALVELARSAGFTPDIIFESDDLAILTELVLAGYGTALVPEHCGFPRQSLVALPIRSSPRRTIGVGTSRARPVTPTTAAVRDIVATEVRHSFAVAETSPTA